MYLRYVKQMIHMFLSFFSHGVKNGKEIGAESDVKNDTEIERGKKIWRESYPESPHFCYFDKSGKIVMVKV